MRGMFEDHCVGSLLGVACGEILGIPAHGLSIAEIRQKFGELRDFQVGLFACGCYGEATEMTLALVETLTEQGWVDPVRAAAKYADCYQNWRPYGKETRGAGLFPRPAITARLAGLK